VRQGVFTRARGVLFALAAAITFGGSTPFVQRYGRGCGAFGVGALLYFGAALANVFARSRGERKVPLRPRDAWRIAIAAIFGAFVGPVALAFALSRTSGVTASLLLNFEAAFTIALGRILYREHIGARVLVAASLIVFGGAIVIWSRGATGPSEVIGLVAVLVATLAWALDSAIGRPLADRDTGLVVIVKGLFGAMLSLVVALAIHEARPPLRSVIGLLICGAVGYGVSTRFYLFAQRELGAARTASVFAFGPFAGAIVALLLHERIGGWPIVIALVLMLVGVALHATEPALPVEA
jgi:drug/metabolite transporter (DMT)-like permease